MHANILTKIRCGRNGGRYATGFLLPAQEVLVVRLQLSLLLSGLATAILLLACRDGEARELSPRFANVTCESFVWAQERFDYRSTAAHDQMRIHQIESNHFDHDTEYLIRAKTGSLGHDIDFVLRYVPNHPRALASLSRLALRDNSYKPSGVSIPVECHFRRGLSFAPDDPAVLTIYGAFLARIDRPKDALARLQEAEKLDPDNAILLYNIGLVLVTLRDYPAARSYAEKAYAKGVTLPGLRDQLKNLGQWKG
jgi:tetratricopeptide (TPR) repeat protein